MNPEIQRIVLNADISATKTSGYQQQSLRERGLRDATRNGARQLLLSVIDFKIHSREIVQFIYSETRVIAIKSVAIRNYLSCVFILNCREICR